MTSDSAVDRPPEVLHHAVVRFAGDSGDGMQLAGDRFTLESAVLGNDLATFPNYPAEIRAPAGTLAGVSSFQIQFGDEIIATPGDTPDVLVAMNPAALRSEIGDMAQGATIIVNTDAFDERNLHKAGYELNPLTDGSLDAYTVHEVPMTALTVEAAREVGAKPRDAERSKNFFALGLVSWLFGRPIEPTVGWIEDKFGKNRTVADANLAALKAGFHQGETREIFHIRYEVRPAELPPGEYRSINGNTALAYGFITAAHLADLPLFLASYPITPASDILHELSRHKNFGVRTLQAEDEIAAAGAALGAAFGGQFAITTTSGPGLDLKSETIGLAIQLELPLVIVDVQRGGPSTGLPTKTEQADLLHAMFGRHGESPIPIVAASTPADCFDVAIEASRIALGHMTPVILLTDGSLANGSEPWQIPDADAIAPFPVHFATEPNHEDADGTMSYWPYQRDERLVRPWAVPGTPGLEHRIGGIEHEDGTGNISYVPDMHEHMVHIRADKVAAIARDLPALEVDDPTGDADILVLTWGSPYGAAAAGVAAARASGVKVAQANLRWLNPFPTNIVDVLAKYPTVLVPENNSGQLAFLLRGMFLKDVVSYPKVKGVPFKGVEIARRIAELAGTGAEVSA